MREKMNVPESMKATLQSWNGGAGIELREWVGCKGDFSLAVGYTTIFCPEFIEFEDYVLSRGELSDDAIRAIRGFESREGSTPMSVEWVMNHIHLADLQYAGCPDLTEDKLLILGEALQKIYAARLHYLFPEKPCIVEFYKPEDPAELVEYQLSFWQRKHDPNYA